MNEEKQTGDLTNPHDKRRNQRSEKKCFSHQNSKPSYQKDIAPLIDLFLREEYSLFEKTTQIFLKHFPKNELIWTLLTVTFVVQGRLSEALNSMRMAVSLSPDWVEGRNNLEIIEKRIKEMSDGKSFEFRKA